MDEVKTDNSAMIARLTRERDEALAEARTLRNAAVGMQEEVERLREHHKVAVDWWMQEAQSVKPLTKEVERLRGITDRQAELIMKLEKGGYKQDAERLRKAITDCLDYANGRQYEWGSRAESAFETLENAIDAAMREGK